MKLANHTIFVRVCLQQNFFGADFTFSENCIIWMSPHFYMWTPYSLGYTSLNDAYLLFRVEYLLFILRFDPPPEKKIEKLTIWRFGKIDDLVI